MAQAMLGIHVGPAGLRGLLPLEFYNSQVVQRGRALLAGARRLARAAEIIGKTYCGAPSGPLLAATRWLPGINIRLFIRGCQRVTHSFRVSKNKVWGTLGGRSLCKP